MRETDMREITADLLTPCISLSPSTLSEYLLPLYRVQ